MGGGLKKLHVSLHDVSPAHEPEVREAHSLLRGIGVDQYSMLVIPDHEVGQPMKESPEFCEWLARLSAEGVEIVQHGFRHGAGARNTGPFERLRAALFTRGEGEFLGLDEKEALELMSRGRKTVEEALGVVPESFVAPAWLYSAGTLRAMRSEGFRATESRWRIFDPVTGRTLVRTPVANYAGGGPVRRSLAALWVFVCCTALSGANTLRFAIHPRDMRPGPVREALPGRIEKLLRGRVTVRLADLAAAP